MRQISAFVTSFMLSMGVALGASASDTCTIAYELEGTLELTDTSLGRGDTVASGLDGLLVLQFETGDGDEVVDGEVDVLHFAIHEVFEIDSVAKVATDVHMFTPSCSGVTDPSWRKPSDPGFPKLCRYRGNTDSVARGELRREDERIVWSKCKADDAYWSKGRTAFTLSSKNRGKGCLNDVRAVGNVACSGVGCRLGGLSFGDNPMNQSWTQPMIHGPRDGDASVYISRDLSTLRTPISRPDGHQSYNLPNDAPSRSWVSWRGRRLNASPHTTCPEP